MGLGKVGSIIIIVLASVSISSLSQAAVQDLGIIELGTLNLGDLTNTIRQLNHQESLSGYTAFTAGYTFDITTTTQVNFAAVILFGTGLLCLAGIARRKRAAHPGGWVCVNYTDQLKII